MRQATIALFQQYIKKNIFKNNTEVFTNTQDIVNHIKQWYRDVLSKESEQIETRSITFPTRLDVIYLLSHYLLTMGLNDDIMEDRVRDKLMKKKMKEDLLEKIEQKLPIICMSLAKTGKLLNLSHTETLLELMAVLVTKSICFSVLGAEEGNMVFELMRYQEQEIINDLAENKEVQI